MNPSFLAAVLAIFIFSLQIEITPAASINVDYVSKLVNETVEIPLPAVATYRRKVLNANLKSENHIYRVCNGKNKAKCGFWENVKTKKKVASGKTTYNKNKKMMIVKNLHSTDFGTYMTGDKKKSFEVLEIVKQGWFG